MKSDRTQVLSVATFVGLLLLSVWVGGAFWAYSERQRVIAAREIQLGKLTIAVEEQTLRLFKLTEASLLAAANWIKEHPKAYPGEDPSFIELVSGLRRVSDDTVDIRFIDAKGGIHIIPSTSRQPVGNVANMENIRLQFSPLTRGLLIGDPTISQVDNKWIVAVTYPVLKPDGEVLVLAAVLELDRTARQFELQRDKPNGSITILKANGVTLFRSPAISGSTGKSIAKAPDFLEHLSASDRGSYRAIGAFDGVERLVSHARLNSYPVIIAVTSSLDDALMPWRQELATIFPLILLLTLVTGIGTRYYLHVATDSQRHLAESERRFRSLMEHAPEAILVFDPASNAIVETNPQAEKLFRRPREDLLSLAVDQLFAPVQPGGIAAEEVLRQVVAQTLAGEEVVLEASIRPPAGRDAMVELRADDMVERGHRLIRASFIDIEERKRADKALRESEKHIRLLFNSGNDPIFVYEADSISGAPLGRFVEVNDVACSSLGYSREELLRLSLEDIVAPEMAAHPAPYVKLAFCRTVVYESALLARDGHAIPVEINAHLFELYDKALVFAMARDVSERKESEQSLRLAASVFGSTQEGIMITDANNRIVDVNAAFTQITGYAREEVLRRDPSLLNSGHQEREFYTSMWSAITGQGHWQGEVWNRRKSGEIYAQRLTISVVVDERGQVTHYVGIIADITAEKQQKELLEKTAHYDALTGIPNRVLLTDRMRQALAQTQRSRTLLAVCYLDLDGFKPINDSFGHEAGDHVLIEVATRLRACLRGGDTVARLGGDEFVVLLLGLDSIDECNVALQRLLDALCKPLSVCGKTPSISASIGVSLYPMDDADSDTLLRHADQAMYQAKQSGKGRYQIFAQEAAKSLL